jgi:DNA repair exonuclease SbcCD ATPase subunit
LITFEKLRYKNFLSTGDAFTEIDFNKTSTTLVVGQNGAGKSTMLDALSFALFGKAHRNVNKPQLINSINGKSCLVEVEFVALGHQYKIVRGLKPAKFEIWQDSTMINQDSHAKEYQKILEQNILKLNHKSFHQIVVLGSSSFVPFMQLPAQHRREVIEDLLDINVFSKMNQFLKEKIAVLKDTTRENEYQLELNKTKIDTQEDHIFELEKISEIATNKLENDLHEQKSELARLEKFVEGYTDTQLREIEKLLFATKKQIDKLEKFDFQFDSKIKKFDKDVKFYEDNDTCPTCDQEIAADIKSKKFRETFDAKGEIEDAKLKLSFEIAKHYDEMTCHEKILSEETSKFQDVEVYRRDIKSIKSRIDGFKMSRCTGVTLNQSNQELMVYKILYPRGGNTWIVCKPQNLRLRIFKDLVRRSLLGNWTSQKNGNIITLLQSCSKTRASKPKLSNNICPLLTNLRTNTCKSSTSMSTLTWMRGSTRRYDLDTETNLVIPRLVRERNKE